MSGSGSAESVGVVVVFGHRHPLSMLNLMRTLAAQTRLPEALALINFGPPCPEFEAVAPPFHYIYRHLPQGPVWCRPLAANQGVRLLPPVDSVFFVDADMLLAPNFIESGLRRLQREALLNCVIMDLPQGAVTVETDVVHDFDRLRSLSKTRAEITALGACQWLRMEVLQAMRGRDEGFRMWCFEDMDFQRRARWLGLQPIPLDEETTMLHQWHVTKDEILQNPNAPQTKAARYWYQKNLQRLRTRALLWDVGKFQPQEVNSQGWGTLV